MKFSTIRNLRAAVVRRLSLAAGAALVFGEELGGIAKKALYVVLGVAMIVMGNKFLSALGLSGAVI